MNFLTFYGSNVVAKEYNPTFKVIMMNMMMKVSDYKKYQEELHLSGQVKFVTIDNQEWATFSEECFSKKAFNITPVLYNAIQNGNIIKGYQFTQAKAGLQIGISIDNLKPTPSILPAATPLDKKTIKESDEENDDWVLVDDETPANNPTSKLSAMDIKTPKDIPKAVAPKPIVHGALLKLQRDIIENKAEIKVLREALATNKLDQSESFKKANLLAALKSKLISDEKRLAETPASEIERIISEFYTTEKIHEGNFIFMKDFVIQNQSQIEKIFGSSQDVKNLLMTIKQSIEASNVAQETIENLKKVFIVHGQNALPKILNEAQHAIANVVERTMGIKTMLDQLQNSPQKIELLNALVSKYVKNIKDMTMNNGATIAAHNNFMSYMINAVQRPGRYELFFKLLTEKTKSAGILANENGPKEFRAAMFSFNSDIQKHKLNAVSIQGFDALTVMGNTVQIISNLRDDIQHSDMNLSFLEMNVDKDKNIISRHLVKNNAGNTLVEIIFDQGKNCITMKPNLKNLGNTVSVATPRDVDNAIILATGSLAQSFTSKNIDFIINANGDKDLVTELKSLESTKKENMLKK